jgi:hypothetical protein
MSGAIHSLPQYAFMAWCLVKAQVQLYFYLTLIQDLCSTRRDSSVGIALGYGLDDRGSIPGGC